MSDQEAGTVAAEDPTPQTKREMMLGSHVPTELITVEFPGMGEIKLEVRGLTVKGAGDVGKTIDEYDEDIRHQVSSPIWVIAGTFDPDDGTPVFSDADIPALIDAPAKPVNELCNKILSLSGFDTRVDGEDKKAVGEAPGA